MNDPKGILDEVKKAVVGKDGVLVMALLAILAGGHILLEDIPGVGPARRKALMRAYSSLEDIKNATVEELMEKAGLPRNSAEAVYNHFHT